MTASQLAWCLPWVLVSTVVRADDQVALPAPLRVVDVVRLARDRRAEVVAARARASAARERPAITSALDDPQIFASLDHVPFMGGGADASLLIEQSFPLSRIRGHRRDVAEADARRAVAEIDRVGLDVELDAAGAFWMLAEIRDAAKILENQRELAAQVVSAATARYATSSGPQADVLRAQLEIAKLDGEQRASAAEIRAAEAMLNASLARTPDAPIPELDAALPDDAPPVAADVEATAGGGRPELRVGRAEIARSEAEVAVMEAMSTPMAMVRTGPSYTMSDGAGWMVMVGLTVPLWRDKLHAEVAEARSMADMARADLDAMRRMVTAQAAAARERVIAARERYLALRDSIVPRARDAMTATLAAYAANQLPLVGTLDAAQALWSAQRDLVMARAELGRAWARLCRATGEGVKR